MVMGNATSSQTVKEYVTNSTTYSQAVKSSLNLENSSDIISTNTNTFTLNNGGAQCCLLTDSDGNPLLDGNGDAMYLPNCDPTAANLGCDDKLTLTQTVDSNISVIQSIDSEYAQQLSTQLQNTAQTDISNALDQLQENDMISGWGNSTKQDVETSIVNEINTTLTSETILNIVNSAVVNSGNTNAAVFNNCATLTANSCNFDQNISSQIVIQNILSSVGDLLESNSQINDFYTTLTDTLTQKQEGTIGSIADVFTSLFDMLGEFALLFLIGGAIVGLLFVIGFIYALFFKGKKSNSGGGSTQVVMAPAT